MQISLRFTLPLLLAVAGAATPAMLQAQVTTTPAATDEAPRRTFAASLVGAGAREKRGSVTIRGKRVDYISKISGTGLVDADGRPSAIFVAMSYTRIAKDASRRPVIFAWNGGPSGASFGLHFGVLGPKIRESDANGRQLSPPRLIDNDRSILDRADLVMVDPVGTGLSVAVGGHKLSDFYSINGDAASVAQFIKKWLEANGRTGSPVYLMGESYGTIRVAVATNHLQEMGVPVAGQIHIGPALNGQTIWESPAHLDPFIFYLPAYAVSANYHGVAPGGKRDTSVVWKEASAFAMGEYLKALYAWPDVTPEEKASVLQKLERFTGIGQDVWLRNDIRLSTTDFAMNLLKDKGLIMGLSDARSTIPVPKPGTAPAPFDFEEAFIGAYIKDSFGIAGAPKYRALAPGSENWFWLDHGLRTRAPKVPGYQNFLDDVAKAMKANPRMRIMQNSGIYDILCNAFPADWAIRRMAIPAELRKNITIFDYEAGHAVFEKSPTEFVNFTDNLVAYLDAADTASPTARP